MIFIHMFKTHSINVSFLPLYVLWNWIINCWSDYPNAARYCRECALLDKAKVVARWRVTLTSLPPLGLVKLVLHLIASTWSYTTPYHSSSRIYAPRSAASRGFSLQNKSITISCLFIFKLARLHKNIDRPNTHPHTKKY